MQYEAVPVLDSRLIAAPLIRRWLHGYCPSSRRPTCYLCAVSVLRSREANARP